MFFFCLLEYFDLLGKKLVVFVFFSEKPRLKFHSKNLSPPCMENTVWKTPLTKHPNPQLGPPLLAVPNLTSPNSLDIPRIRKPSSWIIAIRQSRQDDELSEFFHHGMDGEILHRSCFFPLK